MSTTIGVVTFVVALLVSVMLHEWGHYKTARHYGMKVSEFFVGFGPRLWSVRRGETEYGVKAIPAGGYVRIIGMTDVEPVAPEDEPRAFYRAPARQKAVVLSAGSFMHLVIGFVLLLFVFAVLGRPQPSTTVASVSSCVPASATAGCTASDPASPAAKAGLKPGDELVSFNGTPVTSWEQATTLIRSVPGETVPIVVKRDGQPVDLTVTVAGVQRPAANGTTETVGLLGVSSQLVMDRANPVSAVGQAFSGVWTILKGTVQALWTLPQKVVELWQSLFNGQPRDPNGLVGVVGAADISGQLAGGGDGYPVVARGGDILLLIAGFNLFVGVFNMLPLLPLDGGHLAVVGYESLRSWWARRRGRPDPGRVDMAKLMPLAYAVFVLFVGLTVLLVTADIVKPVQL